MYIRRLLLILTILLVACSSQPEYDVIIRGGTIYDGSGNAPIFGDVGVKNDRIVAIGNLEGSTATSEINAEGKAVGRQHH
jgi:N-acyl-D-amino-acid deacylase